MEETARFRLLVNEYRHGIKVLSALMKELSACQAFDITVAFISASGLAPLLGVFKELEEKGVPGRILTTDYLSFSDPRALDKLAGLKNISLKMYQSTPHDGFHTKGYIFRYPGAFHIIVGSSNLTASALSSNQEWNAGMNLGEEHPFAKRINDEFERLWNSPNSVSYEDVRYDYTRLYYQSVSLIHGRQVKQRARPVLTPNKMQTDFIASFQALRRRGEHRAMLISATGTGKTYASAFALRTYMPKRMLFLVHREQIARQAMETYQKIFLNTRTYGRISGSRHDYDADFIFATVQSMARPDIRAHFPRDHFDTIIIDEVHRAGAGSYLDIMAYFQPDFWLGMTASPERTDGFDIFSLFDHNIVYEIRLQAALREDLLCPFHYYGITDLTLDEKTYDERTGFAAFQTLVREKRADYIMRQAEYYGYSGPRVKGLIFVSRKDEGKELAKLFNQKGWRTVFLDGSSSQAQREACIARLTKDHDNPDPLDYIITVEIFNEGVDIPEINQVIMLRPTQSAIIFIQQLGRGLRKYPGKDYVMVLDFIGNYTQNFLIPVALSGDRSYNKDNMRRFISEEAQMIPGYSSIHFDEISKARIFQAIDRANTMEAKFLDDAYQNLKFKLGHIPSLLDFDRYGEIDAAKFIMKWGSYYHFLVAKEPEYNVRLSPEKAEVIRFLSKKLSAGKRPHEWLVLKLLLEKQDHIKSQLVSQLHDYEVNDTVLQSVYGNLTNQFAKTMDQPKYQNCVFLVSKDDEWFIHPKFEEMLEETSFSEMISELISYAMANFHKSYQHHYRDTAFVLGQKYTYEDVCLLLNWKKNINAQSIGGYLYNDETKTLPVFINYDKESDAIAYEDRFLNRGELVALSKTNRAVTSADAIRIYKSEPEYRDVKIYLFVRKNKDDKEAKEFYFLGEMRAIGKPEPVIMPQTGKPAFEIHYQLETPVAEDLYDYIVHG